MDTTNTGGQFLGVCVKFFIDKEKDLSMIRCFSTEHSNVLIPQINSTVSIGHELLKVKNVEYHYSNFESDYDVINVFVEHMEDENYEDFD